MIPWREWFAFAVATLRLSPEAFWSLSLAEWRWLLPEAGEAMNGEAMTRDSLGALLLQYPDEMK